FFISTLSFGVSTLVKNGNATAVIVIIIGIVFFIIHDSIDNSKWNLFLNPFRSPSSINEIVWANTIKQNRLILFVVGVVFLLLGLLNLQKREKFLR
ncbi:MAG: hypothetical protein MI922_25190, partial [Bacteroidales bacterium]|nr:hypothetical protein [Bacteroidales bacterium]